MAIDLKPRGIAVAIFHPGLVRTRMVAFNPQGIPPQQAVGGLLARFDALTLATTGIFWHASGGSDGVGTSLLRKPTYLLVQQEYLIAPPIQIS